MKFVVQVVRSGKTHEVKKLLEQGGIAIAEQFISWGHKIDEGSYGSSDLEITKDTFFVCEVNPSDRDEGEILRDVKRQLFMLEYCYVPNERNMRLGESILRSDRTGDIDLVKYDDYFERSPEEGGIWKNPPNIHPQDFEITRMQRLFSQNERNNYRLVEKAEAQLKSLNDRKITSESLGVQRDAFVSEASRWCAQYFGLTGSEEERAIGKQRLLQSRGQNLLRIAMEGKMSAEGQRGQKER